MLRWIKKHGVKAVLVGAAGVVLIGFQAWQHFSQSEEDAFAESEQTDTHVEPRASELSNDDVDSEEEGPRQPESWGVSERETEFCFTNKQNTHH